MRDQLLEFFASREEKVSMGGKQYLVRTLPDEESIKGDDSIYQFVVRCTFDAEGNRVFTDEDIPALKATPRVRKARLLAAVSRVNAFDPDDEEKNSEAGPSSG